MQDTDAPEHVPVLLEEVLAALRPRSGGAYVDCTFGRGGHALALLAAVGPSARVLGIDRDPGAVAAGGALARGDARLTLIRGRFGELARLMRTEGLEGGVDGILFDLGVSSPQLEDPARGFGFRVEGPLDMRMDPGEGESAADWLARAPREEMARVIARYGEERHARRIARAIDAARRRRPIRTTRELAETVARAVPGRAGPGPYRHPATRTFQAIRIHVNAELEELGQALGQVPDVLAPGGRLAVVSFHSLEDRLVKRFIRDQSRPARAPKGMPVLEPVAPPRLRPVGKAVRPSPEEVRANPRARSAVLRVAEKPA